MKIFKLPQLAELSDNGEYLLSRQDLGSSSAYMLYGRLRPKEAARKVTTEDGNEEIIFMLKGAMRVKSGKSTFTVSAGEAFLSKEAQPFYLDNPGEEEAIYVAAGSRAAGEHPHKQAAKPEADADQPPTDDSRALGNAGEDAAEEEFEITQDEDEDASEDAK